MMKKMYVVQSDDGEFWCGMNIWEKQLRKSKIFHSLKYAGECCERFKQRNPKIVEVSLTIVPETKTNADIVRTEMLTIEGLAEYLVCWLDDWGEYSTPVGHIEDREEAIRKTVEWLQQEAE